MEKVAIFGLTGDPVTSAHLEIVGYLSKNFDRVIVVPTNVNYYKNYKDHDRAMFSYAERYEALKTKCSVFTNVVVSDIEREIKVGWRFLNTLDTLISQYGSDNEYYVAIGSDSLQNFKTWFGWEDILKKAKLVVFNRPGYETGFPEDIEYEYIPMNNKASSTALRAKLMAFMENQDFDEWMDDLTWAKGVETIL